MGKPIAGADTSHHAIAVGEVGSGIGSAAVAGSGPEWRGGGPRNRDPDDRRSAFRTAVETLLLDVYRAAGARAAARPGHLVAQQVALQVA